MTGMENKLSEYHYPEMDGDLYHYQDSYPIPGTEMGMNPSSDGNLTMSDEVAYVHDYSDLYSYSYGTGGYSYVDYSYGPDYVEFIISDDMTSYLSPVLLAIGLIGNAFTVIIMLSLASSHLSSCVYLAVLAIIDMIQLCITRGNMWMNQVFKMDITSLILTQSNVSCQVYSFLMSIVNMSNWILVVTLLEMCLVSIRPERAHRICTRERAKNIILVLILFLICVNAHFFWTYGLVAQHWALNSQMSCTFTPTGSYYSEYFRSEVWPIMDMLGSLLLPDFFILILIVLIYRHTGCRQDRKAHALYENHFVLNAPALQYFRRIMLALGILCIMGTLPESGYNIFEFVLEKKAEASGLPVNYEMKFFAQRALAQTLTSACRDLFISCKIFVYCIAWRRFRWKLLRLISCYYCRQRYRARKNTVTTSSTTHDIHDTNRTICVKYETGGANVVDKRERCHSLMDKIQTENVHVNSCASRNGQLMKVVTDV